MSEEDKAEKTTDLQNNEGSQYGRLGSILHALRNEGMMEPVPVSPFEDVCAYE